VDRHELCVWDGGLRQQRQVVAFDERDQVVDQRRHVYVVRRDEVCLVWPERRSTDPDLLLEARSSARPHMSAA
jgi:hypothetical protein